MKIKHEISSTDSEAALLNTRVMQKLLKSLRNDPEADIVSLLLTGYSERLSGRKKQKFGEHHGLVI